MNDAVPPLAAAPAGGPPLSLVATLAGRLPPEPVRPADRVRCVEVRADLAGDVDPGPIRHRFPGAVLYSLRSVQAGGRCADPDDRRRARLIAAGGRYDYVDLDADRDLHPDVLARIPPHRRVLSWHGPATDLAGLRRRFADLSLVGAHLYRLAPTAGTMAQAVAPLLLLRSLARRDVTAYARGAAGTWTRVLAARYGAPVAFGRLADHEGTPDDGEVPLRRLADYPERLIFGAERVHGIVGAATAGSLCPLAHNTAYRSLGVPALFLPFSTGELPRWLAELRTGLDELGLPLRALAVVAPHKDAAFALAAEMTTSARRAGSASLLLRTPAGWWGDTEADGVVAALTLGGVEVIGRPVAVVGCGGAGRAAAAGLDAAGARVTLVNRGAPAGRWAAGRLGVPFVPLAEFDPRPYAVVVNATPAAPFRVDRADPGTVIFDLSYAATETALIAAARAAGRPSIDGRVMILVELSRQFHRMTGRHIPPEIVRAAQREFGLEPAADPGRLAEPGQYDPVTRSDER